MAQNETNSPEKGHKIDRFVASLLTARTFEEAAKSAGISRTTGWRWLQNPVVVEKFRTARRDAMHRALTLVQTAAAGSVKTLIGIQQDADEPASARVTAAKAILDTALRSAELTDFSERLTALEQARGSRGKGDNGNAKQGFEAA